MDPNSGDAPVTLYVGTAITKLKLEGDYMLLIVVLCHDINENLAEVDGG